MVEEWNVGDEFEVIIPSTSGYFKVGEKGKVSEKSAPESKVVYFTPNASIYKDRIKKINKINSYELW